MRVFATLAALTFVLAVLSGILIDLGWRFHKDVVSIIGHVSLALAIVALVSTWIYIGVAVGRWM